MPSNPFDIPIDTLVPIINGWQGAQINEAFLTFKPFDGGSSGGTYEGLDNIIQELIPELILLGWAVDYKKSKSPISTVRFSAAFSSANGRPTNPNADYIDTWELVRNTVQKELLESNHPLVSVCSASNLTILKNIISGSGPDVWTGDPTTTFNNNPSADYNAAVYLYALFQAGVTTTEVKQPILRLTRTTNPQYTTPFNVDNIDTLLTTQSMLNDSGVPNSFAIPLIALANQLVAKTFPNGTPNPPVQVRADGLNLEFAWLKDLTSSTKHGSQRIQFILEYKFGLWDQGLYGVAV